MSLGSADFSRQERERNIPKQKVKALRVEENMLPDSHNFNHILQEEGSREKK